MQKTRKKRSEPASSPAIPWCSRLGLLREELAGIVGGGAGLLVENLQGDLSGVLFGIVDVLAVIPVTGSDNLIALNRDGTRPGGATSCISDARTISIPLSKARTKKVGVRAVLGFSLLSPHPAMPRHAALRQGVETQERKKKLKWSEREKTVGRAKMESGRYLADRTQC